MYAVTIEGVPVLFPFEPYQIQINYMSAVIKCLQQKSNALLESPTGTGKTLSLLCSALGWLDTVQAMYMKQMLDKRLETIEKGSDATSAQADGFGLGPKMPQILYSSRTHSQLSQACKELKTTAYTSFRSVVIGSRDQLCIDSDVMKQETNWAKNQMCRMKINSQTCPYYKGLENKVDRSEDFQSNRVFDIEDLLFYGRKNKCCPYYASRYIKTKSQLIFMPYNYILDPQIRKSNNLELKNAIIIFDEGHNIEQQCEESVSAELRSETFSLCIKQFDSLLKTLKQIEDGTYDGFDAKEYEEIKIVEIAQAKMMICDFEMAIDSFVRKSKTPKTYHETKDIFDILQKINFNANSCSILCSALETVSSVLNSTKDSETTSNQKNLIINALGNLAEFLEKLLPIQSSTSAKFQSFKQEIIHKFRIFSEIGGQDSNNFWNKDPNSWILHLWCMSPSIGVKALIDMGINCMIITSGTLTPIDSFDVEMGTSFPIKLQNGHIIKANQMAVFNMSNARDGTVLTSKYDNRNNLQYIKALGQTLIEVMSVVPKGMLIFFSSYTALNKCIDVWKGSSNVWDKMNTVKQIFMEPRNKRTFAECIMKYKAKIDENDSSGAAFFAVCRGKLSEGIDLPNDYCRGVIMTGLPFPPVADPRVILKKQYLSQTNTKLSPDGWYTLQMKRALNQSIGRIVRHKDDFGVIILMDSRFAFMRDGLSKWVESFIHKNRGKTFDDYLRELSRFFGTQSSYTRPVVSETQIKLSMSAPARPSGIHKKPRTGQGFVPLTDIAANQPIKTEANPLNRFATSSDSIGKKGYSFKSPMNQKNKTNTSISKTSVFDYM